MPRQRINITMTEQIRQEAKITMKMRGFENFSEFLSVVVHEEFERRTLERPPEADGAIARVLGAAAADQSPPQKK